MLWSAVTMSPHEVDGEIPSARFRGLLASCTRGFRHPAHVTSRILWERRKHIAVSLWFGIVGSQFPDRAFLFGFSASVSARIGYNRRR